MAAKPQALARGDRQEGEMIRYNPGKGVTPYLKDATNRMVLLTGPIGCGKTTAALFKMITIKSGWVVPGDDGIRRSRFAVIAPGFRDTVLRTFLDWFPPHKLGGGYDGRGDRVTLRFDDREVEVLFFDWNAVRRWEFDGAPDLTGAVIDSAHSAEWAKVALVASRVGRYPARVKEYSVDLVSVPSRYDEDGNAHWMYKRFKTDIRSGYACYELTQETGAGQLPDGYYDWLGLELGERRNLVYGEWD